MPSERDRESARTWLARARSDLLIAGMAAPTGVLPEDLCFHAQQAAEKALKAVLVLRAAPFRRVHDLSDLASCVEEIGVTVPEAVWNAAALTHFAANGRYPGDYEPATEADRQRGEALARAVVEWAASLVGEAGKENGS
jgi:HEPN domain-containing protein